jgi:hypothetical protein
MNMPLLPVDGAYVASSADWLLQSICDLEPSDPNNPGQSLYDWYQSAVAPDGNVHQFGSGSTFSCPAFPMRSLDVTGLLQKDATTVVMTRTTT